MNEVYKNRVLEEENLINLNTPPPTSNPAAATGIQLLQIHQHPPPPVKLLNKPPMKEPRKSKINVQFH